MGKSILASGCIAILVIVIGFSACKTGKAPTFKKYVMKESLINIKGLNVPDLNNDRMVFRLDKSLEHDMKNSLESKRIEEVYGNTANPYKEAVKHHLIKSTAVNVKSYSYEEVKYDQTYNKSSNKHDITYYYYDEDDTLNFIQETKMQVIHLEENISTGNASNSEYANEALVEFTCVFNYYPNGKIRHYSCILRKATAGSKVIDLPTMPIGTEHHYDTLGNLKVSFDHEEGFKMEFSTVLTIALRGRNEIINKYKVVHDGVGILYITRNKNEHGSFWIIPYQIGSKRLLYRIIDDRTGQIKDEFEANEQLLQKYSKKTEDYINKINELRKSFN